MKLIKQSKQFRKDLQLNKITIVVNNFYLEDKAAFFETIDVGGPTMTRTAAKMGLLNGSVAVITSHKQYEQVVKEIEHGEITKETKHNLAIEAFKLLRNYNIKIVDYLLEKYK